MNGFSPLALLSSIILSLGMATLALFLGMLLNEVRERWQAFRWQSLVARYQEPVALLVAGEIAPAELLRLVQPRDRLAVTDLLLAYAVHVQLAEEQSLLVTVFRRFGAVERAMRESWDWRWWIRTAATLRLGQMRDPESLGRLRTLLQDRHPEVRTAALWSTIQLGGELPTEVLVQSVASGRLVSSLRVAGLFLEAGRRIVPALCAFLDSSTTSEARAQALLLAGELHAFAAEPAVLAALRSPSGTVREAACRALGKLESLGALAGLVGALRDPEWPVRAAAAEALGRMGDPAAIPALARLLTEPNPTALLAACRALGQLGPEGAQVLHERLRVLTTALSAGRGEARSERSPVARGLVLAQQVLLEVLAEVGP
ncbi:MAG TPA: HEAT repeat domain-containing protein [Symbiobacteriaceae bacterium]|nr:HEAT repeat domain-containing protein [Symbiobacteriaceae bacterium]